MNGLTGKSIRGYEIKREIGEGGFGAIYLAYQEVVGREVAIKIILPLYANNPEFIRRFETEAQLVARLENLHIVPLYDYWRDPEGAYLVMRYLRGGNLQTLLERQKPDLDTTTRIMTQISTALTVAHRNEVIHRDIKPANILLDEEGNAYLSDFGIAYVTGGKRTDREDEVTGTLAYLSPEQLTSGYVTPASDIYSLGIVLYEMLTGLHPFANSTITQLVHKQMHEPLPLLPAELPAGLDAVIQRATHKDPEERYPDALSMVADFHTALNQEMVSIGLSDTYLAAENPYKGLRAFDEADADDFFGRSGLIEGLVKRLAEEVPYKRFLAVVGPSGSGKSSVVRAGLIPALKRDAIEGSSRWFYASLTPNIHPLEELQQALMSIAARPVDNLEILLKNDSNGLVKAVNSLLPENTEDVMLVIDQFEEVFTLALDGREAQQFLKLLQYAVTDPKSRLRIVVTLRADFYDRPLLQPALSQLMRERTEVVIPFTPHELEDAITGPLRDTGVQIESGLVAAIVADVSEQPGALPLLQYTLTQLFDWRDRNTLRLEAYRQLGGTLGALASRADEVYYALSPDSKRLAKQLFLRLVTLGEGTEDTRRRALLSEIQSISPDIKPVYTAFDQSRLLTFDRDPLTREPTVEIAHEAIIRQWKLLKQWLDESRDDVRLQRFLGQEAANWVNAKRDKSYLLRDAKLAQFEEWTNRSDIALTPLEKAYLDTSIQQQQKAEEEEQARREREILLEQSSANRTRLLIVALIAAVIGIGLTVFATDQAVKARDSEEEALALRAESASLAQASLAQRAYLENNDTDLGIALALEANEVPSLIARNALAQIALAPGTRRVFQHDGSGLGLVDFSPDGGKALVGTYDGIAMIWDVRTGETLLTLEGHENDLVYAVDFSPDGTRAVTGADGGEMFLWNAQTGEAIRELEGHSGDINNVAFSPDRRLIASASYDETVILWDTETGEIVHQLAGGSRQLVVDFSPDGHILVSGSADGSILVWDVRTGERLNQIEGHGGEVWYIRFLDDETIISAAYEDADGNHLIVRNISTGTVLNILRNNATTLNAMAVSDDGRYALVSYGDSTFVQWDIQQGRLLRQFKGHTDLIYGLAFAPNSTHAFSTDLGGVGRLWDLRNGAEINRLENNEGGYATAIYNGDNILSAYQNGMVMSVESETLTTLWKEGTSIIPINLLTAQGERFAIAGGENSFAIGDVETGELENIITHTSAIRSIAFTPDGSQIITGDDEFNVIVWDIESGEIVQMLSEHDAEVRSIAINVDLLVTGTGAGDFNTDTLIFWNLASAEPSFILNPGAVNAVAINPDGTNVASALNNGTVILWDSTTGKQIRTLNGHSAVINSVRFSSDGSRLVTGANDNTMIVWDTATGTAIRRLYGHSDWVRSAEFRADGTRILSSSQGGTVRQWRVIPDDQLVEWTRINRYVRELTCEERDLYGVEPSCD
jgi:WD40 repeat protein/serine/threonine protein kinase